MKHFALILIAILIAASCSNKPKTEQKKTITVSILPQKYMVEQIAGDFLTVNVMLAPGASPADYEPFPKQIQDLNNSSIYFYIGHLGFEKSWMKKFNESADNVLYVSCSNGIDLLRGDPEQDIDHGNHNHHGTDPHIWTSPENVKTISRTICSTLSKNFPEKASEFEANLTTFISRIDMLDNTIREVLADSTNTSFMIFHPALGYYARDYHLDQNAIEFEGKSPSPAYLMKMIDLAKEKNITTIFIQSQFETTKAEAIAKEIGAEVVSIDPLAENWLAEMYSLTKKMAKAIAN